MGIMVSIHHTPAWRPQAPSQKAERAGGQRGGHFNLSTYVVGHRNELQNLITCRHANGDIYVPTLYKRNVTGA